MRINLALILLVLFLSDSVNAYQDVYINITSRSMGLCLSDNTLDNPVCENQTLVLDGTSDHTLYIMSYTNLRQNSSIGEVAQDTLITPLNVLLIGFGFLIATFVICLSIVVAFSMMFNSLNKGG